MILISQPLKSNTMKKLYPFIALMIIAGSLFAQTPHMFNYQAVIRDSDGQPLSEENISLQIVLLQGGAEGTEVFSETHQTQTNELGLVNMQVGSINSLEDIDWVNEEFYIQIIVDDTEMGTTQLLSVPFALHAATSADAFSGDYQDLENTPDLSAFLMVENPQHGDLLYFSDGEWHTLSPGEEDQVLMVVDGLPQWADIPAGDNGDDGTVTDYDGNVYHTIEFGDQEWFASNLRVTHYRDGSPIPSGLSNSEWNNTTAGASAVQPHDNVPGIDSEEEMVAAYGRMYNWYAVIDTRELCPAGWRVATDEDWTILNNFINNDGHPGVEGNAVKSCRQEDSPLGGECDTDVHPRWNAHADHYGTDDYGFSALPGGFRRDDGPYLGLGANGYWWTATQSTEAPGNGWYRAIRNYQAVIARGDFDKRCGFYVRCVRD